MKIICLLITLFCLTAKAYSQTGYLIKKDSRIDAHQDSIISFLIHKKQFDINNPNFKRSEYEGKIFVKKCLEIFDEGDNDVLLVKFGSLGDHAQNYWGILSRKNLFILYSVKDKEFKKFTIASNRINKSLITNYLHSY